MNTIRFSIVIPTLNRHETLSYTIKSCLCQKYDNFEIIISDNCSTPETKELIDNFDSEKIKYYRTTKTLAMTDNWEFAVSKAKGEYIIVIGDDDGLLLHSLFELDKLITKFNFKVIRWERVNYSWPNIPISEAANKVSIPLRKSYKIIEFDKIIPLATNYQLNYTILPMLYNSVIHQDIIDLLIKKTGRVFMSRSPDIYSGFAFAYLSKEYLSLDFPMSINAGSAKSNGVSNMVLKNDNHIQKNFKNLNNEAGINCHPLVPEIREMPAVIADSFSFAKDSLFPDNNRLALNQKDLIKNCVQQLFTNKYKYPNKDWESNLQIIKEFCFQNKRLCKWFNELILAEYPENLRKQYKTGVINDFLNLDASEFGVTDVFGIAELTEKILSYSKLGIEGLHEYKNEKYLNKILLNIGKKGKNIYDKFYKS